MLSLPQATKTQLCMPNRSLGTLPAGAPSVPADAQGKVGDGNTVMVEVDGACTVNIYIFSKLSKAWRLMGNTTSTYQKVFAAAGIDYFVAPAGALFYIQAASGTVTGYTDGISL